MKARHLAAPLDWRRRAAFLFGALAVMAIGLGSRRFGSYLPTLVAEYAGDLLWALMLYLGLSLVAPTARILHRSAVVLVVSFAIEVSQLYHAPWIDAIRHTTLGGLVLGFGFLWSDLVCYTLGIAAGAVLEQVTVQLIGISTRAQRV